MNFVRWTISSIEGRRKETGYSFASAVEELQDYVNRRAAWLDKSFGTEE